MQRTIAHTTIKGKPACSVATFGEGQKKNCSIQHEHRIFLQSTPMKHVQDQAPKPLSQGPYQVQDRPW